MANRMILNETSYFGAGSISEIVTEAKKRAFKKALVVTDPDLIKFNVAKNVTDLLEEAGLAYDIFSQVKANPTVKVVKAGIEAFKAADADYLIAIGGGSSMDTAKAIGIIINNPEYADVTSLEGAIDTKMMSSMPKGLTASTGMDALTHAIEGYTTLGAWELTDMMHLKAIEIISRSLRKAVENDPQGREDMALGQYIAGMGFSNVGLGVVHGMAHPLGAFYDTPHGIANAVLLPYVMEYNAEYTGEKFKYIAEAMGVDTTGMSQAEYRAAAVNAVKQLSKDVGIPEKLHEIGVKEEDLQALSESAFADVCTGGNPRPCTVESILGIYKTAF